MGALEVRPGFGMVEARGLEGDDLRLAALMFGVADGAIVGFIAVIALLGGDARGDLRMAGQAFCGSHFPRGYMAGRALGFSRLGNVGRTQGPRHLLGARPPSGSGGQCRGDGQGGEQDEETPWVVFPFGRERLSDGFHNYYFDISYINNIRVSNGSGPPCPGRDEKFLPAFTPRGD